MEEISRKRKRTSEEKAKERVIRNRQAAQESRDRQKRYVKELEEANQTLLKNNELLVSTVSTLQEQNRLLSEKLDSILSLLNQTPSPVLLPTMVDPVNTPFTPIINSPAQKLDTPISPESLFSFDISGKSPVNTMDNLELVADTNELTIDQLFNFDQNDLYSQEQALRDSSDPAAVKSQKQIESPQSLMFFVNQTFISKLFQKRIKAKLINGLIKANHDIYNYGSFGKATLSRGIPTYNAREFESLSEKKKIDRLQLDKIRLQGVKEEFLLLPEECFFLSFALGCLDLNGETKLSIQQQWELFCKDDQFPVRYAVYHHYRSQGYVVRSGILFGTDFVLYKQGPQYRHSDYCVWIVDAVVAKELIEKNRVCNQAKKQLVLVRVQVKGDLQYPTCLDDFVLADVLVKRETF
ncbi:hypothetical protein HDV01_002309 [Terramyces sp. JEL0728]|nr:hypothetical protein HDV01_002309 [Terramyces sp. JEL0728]